MAEGGTRGNESKMIAREDDREFDRFESRISLRLDENKIRGERERETRSSSIG